MIAQKTRAFRKPFTATLAATLLVTGLCWSLAPTAHAEVPPRKLEDLKKTADLIVVGKAAIRESVGVFLQAAQFVSRSLRSPAGSEWAVQPCRPVRLSAAKDIRYVWC